MKTSTIRHEEESGYEGRSKFVERWGAELEKHVERYENVRSELSVWESKDACRDLDETGTLRLVQPLHDARSFAERPLFHRLWEQVQFYKLFQDNIVPSNQCFKDAVDALSAAQSKLKKAHLHQSKVRAAVESDLKRCARMLAEAQLSIEWRREALLRRSLFPDRLFPSRMWPIYIDENNQPHPFPKYPRKLVKRTDLDTLFQLRVGAILRMWLPRRYGVSLRTIGRLTVLTYICGELGKEHDGKLFVPAGTREREITVGLVDQKLRAAGLF